MDSLTKWHPQPKALRLATTSLKASFTLPHDAIAANWHKNTELGGEISAIRDVDVPMVPGHSPAHSLLEGRSHGKFVIKYEGRSRRK